jgi:hypothetical protein
LGLFCCSIGSGWLEVNFCTINLNQSFKRILEA